MPLLEISHSLPTGIPPKNTLGNLELILLLAKQIFATAVQGGNRQISNLIWK